MVNRFEIISPTNNRRDKRAVLAECKNLEKWLYEVEANFLIDLFNDNYKASYKKLYNEYLQQYVIVCELLYKANRVKLLKINTHYFEQIYKPLENELF